MINDVIIIKKNPVNFGAEAYVIQNGKPIITGDHFYHGQKLEEEIVKLCNKYQIYNVQFAGPRNYIGKIKQDFQSYAQKNNLNINVIKEVYDGKVSFNHD